MQFTGERYIPDIEGPEISYEHWHRYLYASRFVAGKAVLDIASGEGFGSEYLARSAARVIGVDVDPEAVRHAASKYIRPNLEFRCGSAEVIPLEGSQLLDVVVSFETIAHIREQQQFQFMNEVKRLLRPQGVFLVSTPNKLLDTDLPSQKNPFHRKEFYFDEYLGLLHKYFCTVHILGQQVYPVSYIWQASASSQSLTEFQLAYSGGVFEPIAGDHKEVLYLLALCSDGEMEIPGNSVLLDISERAIRRPVEQWAKTDQALRQAGANLAANEKTIQALQLKESETSQRGDAQLRQAVEEHALALSAQQDAAQQQIGREWHLDLTALNDLSAQQGAAQQQIAAQQQQIEELANAKAAAQSAAAELHLQMQGLTNEKAAAQSAVVELHRRVEELINEKEAGLREAAELRQAAQELKEQASASAAQVQVMAEREKELREMLLDVHDKLLRRDEEIQTTWATALSQCGPTIAGILAARNGTAPAKTNNYPRLVQQIREVARKRLPPDAVVLVVSKGDQELLRLDRRQAGHFPQDERGVYAGHHPADSAAAIDHLEALRARGAEFLLFPGTSLWWLDHYQEFRQHLKRNYKEVVRLEDVCVIFALNERPTGKEQPYRELVERIRELVHRCLPPNARVCVVSKGDEELLRLGSRTAWHFPQDEYGVYLGHNPADSAAAIALLEASRAQGADFLLFPSTAFWWLEYYREFRQHIDRNHRRVVNDDACVLFRLSRDPKCDPALAQSAQGPTEPLSGRQQDVIMAPSPLNGTESHHPSSGGEKESYDPHPLFDAEWYSQQYPEVQHTGLSPLEHYLRYGSREGRSPHPLFDAKYYWKTYPEAILDCLDPLQHYLKEGWKKGFKPNPNFDPLFYLSTYPDIAAAGVEPLTHFVLAGLREGRTGNPGDLRIEPFEADYRISSEPQSAEVTPDPKVKAIAFYLPQFHPIPENDQWWEKGFTEWTNVRRATPQFEGHYQPQVPVGLGYYDLRDPDVLEKQAELARNHGIHGFCFYYYWFHGKVLLDLPIRRILAANRPDFPFCICWANENWTRRWDGLEREILISQNYSSEDDLAFISNIEPILLHKNYIRVDGKPMLLVYRPGLFPDVNATATLWRDYFRARGHGDLYLVSTRAFQDGAPPSSYGFDAVVQFPPHATLTMVNNFVANKASTFEGEIYNYSKTKDVFLKEFREAIGHAISWRNALVGQFRPPPD